MPLPERDSTVGHSFGLEIDGIAITSIQEVAGLKIEQDVIEMKHNTADGKYEIKKLPGRWKGAELTLTRGLTGNRAFKKWVKEAQQGKMKDCRKGGAIIVYDHEGEVVARYKFSAAWPKSLELGTMKAGDTNVLTEKLVITCERLEAED